MSTAFLDCETCDSAKIVIAYQQISRDAARSGARAEEIESVLRSMGAGPQVAERMMNDVLDETVAALVELRVPERQIVEKMKRRGFDADQVRDSLSRVKANQKPAAKEAKLFDPSSLAIGIIWCLFGAVLQWHPAMNWFLPESLPSVLMAIGGLVMAVETVSRWIRFPLV
jgi:hypothetical protein